MTLKLRDRLTLPSRARYALWRLTRTKRPLVVRLSTGERIALRPKPSTDLDTAYEVFASETYRGPEPLDPARVRLVADLGANVGYSVLYWLRAFPGTRVVAFEPHPAHAGFIRGHVARNGVTDRVTLHEAAAGTAPGEALLSDAENCSSIVGTAGGLRVPVLDVFEALRGLPIDVLKIDIEGAEYPILADPRFAGLAAHTVAMEWHTVSTPPSGPAWCLQRLQELGYRTHHLDATDDHGMIWAYRP